MPCILGSVALRTARTKRSRGVIVLVVVGNAGNGFWLSDNEADVMALDGRKASKVFEGWSTGLKEWLLDFCLSC